MTTILHTDNHLPRNTLVFPATHIEGQNYVQAALERGEGIVQATSEHLSELSIRADGLLQLPYVYEPEFVDAFLSAVKDYSISRVFAPAAAVHIWLERFISENGLSLELIGVSPIKREMQKFDKLTTKALSFQEFIHACAQSDNALSTLEISAIFQMSGNIYGESNDQKIAAMMAVFASAPKGDVVEIGSLVGKSAAVLALLAKRYGVGNFLTIDPWAASPAVQNDSPDLVKVQMITEWTIENIPLDFALNLYPIGIGHSNYIQAESKKGFYKYKQDRSATTQTFGTVTYLGKISVLHIDGNHDYEKVALDCELWLTLLDVNGWLILDDYFWIHGDGPYRVGNDLLKVKSDSIERSFVCGKALFIKFCKYSSV